MYFPKIVHGLTGPRILVINQRGIVPPVIGQFRVRAPNATHVATLAINRCLRAIAQQVHGMVSLKEVEVELIDQDCFECQPETDFVVKKGYASEWVKDFTEKITIKEESEG